jgi:hypothetical protein
MGSRGRAPTEKNAVASQPSISDPAALFCRHRQECLCYQKTKRAAASLQPPSKFATCPGHACQALQVYRPPPATHNAVPSKSRNSAPPRIRVTRETHHTPAAIAARITRAGGTNRYGEPNFRVVWGGARLTWIGGRWTDRDAHGNVSREAIELRQVPKYLPLDRWHIERWMPPEFYGSPDQWRALTSETEDGIRIPALGPYPARGDYEHCFTLQGSAGDFEPLNAAACDYIVRAIEWSRRQTRTDQRAAIAERESRRARDWDRNRRRRPRRRLHAITPFSSTGIPACANVRTQRGAR